MAASLGGYVQVVQALLHHGERGADPLQANESGKTALGLAVHYMLHPGERPKDSFQEDEDDLEGLGIAPRPKMHFLIVVSKNKNFSILYDLIFE